MTNKTKKKSVKKHNARRTNYKGVYGECKSCGTNTVLYSKIYPHNICYDCAIEEHIPMTKELKRKLEEADRIEKQKTINKEWMRIGAGIILTSILTILFFVSGIPFFSHILLTFIMALIISAIVLGMAFTSGILATFAKFIGALILLPIEAILIIIIGLISGFDSKNLIKLLINKLDMFNGYYSEVSIIYILIIIIFLYFFIMSPPPTPTNITQSYTYNGTSIKFHIQSIKYGLITTCFIDNINATNYKAFQSLQAKLSSGTLNNSTIWANCLQVKQASNNTS